MRRLCIATIGWLASCGDASSDPNSCLPDGFSDGVATVQGQELGPWARAAQVSVGTMHALVFDEAAGTCGEIAPTGKHLVVLLCEPPEEKNYRIVPQAAFRCPGDAVFAILEDEDGTDVTKSLDGTLRIDSATGCVRGSYAITMTSIDTIEGMFDAVVCGAN